MIETIKLEPGWLIQETHNAAERFAERVKRDFGVFDKATNEAQASSDGWSTARPVKDSGQG